MTLTNESSIKRDAHCADTLLDTLTVYEMLLYTAQLKRPFSEATAQKRDAVERVIERLSLSDCRNTRIGNALKRGISGGQAKRVQTPLALFRCWASLHLCPSRMRTVTWISVGASASDPHEHRTAGERVGPAVVARLRAALCAQRSRE